MMHRSVSIIATLSIAAAGSIAVAGSLSAQEAEDVTFTASDGVGLAGVLLLPAGEGPFPGAVLIQGSGASDRTNLWARSIAEALAQGGIATLLPDKRGAGRSEGDWLTASFELLARDALAGVKLLEEDDRIDDDAVGLVGLSQGGHIAPLAATLEDDVAFVVDVSGAAVPMLEQIRHEMRNTATQAGLPTEGVETVLEIQRLAEAYVETGAWEPYAAAIERARAGPAGPVAEGFPQTPDSPVWTWARLNGAYDPIPHWREVEAPVLVVYGAEDEEDNVPVAESVRRLEAAREGAAGDDWTIRVFEDTGHALWASDADPHHPVLHPELVALLTEWIRARTR
jgi:pimeloyl-ACP methyl ester carboxylesterase